MGNKIKLLACASAMAAVMGAAAPAMASQVARPDAGLTVKSPAAASTVWGVEGPSYTWKVSGGTAPYTWTITAATPTGTWSTASGTGDDTFSVGGTWEPGSAAASSTTKYSVTVTDSSATKLTKKVSWTVTIAAAPSITSTVGVGADTDQFLLDQIGNNYNATKPASDLYDFDATDPVTGDAGGSILTKTGCSSGAIPRPNGGTAGVAALTASNGTVSNGDPCIDFARAASPRTSTTSTDVSFLALAGDAVTYATTAHSGTSKTNAPSNLTTGELNAIYSCTVTTWNQVPGDTSTATIAPFLPPSGSGVRSFFLAAIGVSVPGTCVNSTVEQNEGVNPLLDSPNALVAFSVGDWLSQAYHDAKCGNSGCTANSRGQICIPTGSDNLYGCDLNGPLVLNEINSTAPTTPYPATKKSTINTTFSADYLRVLYSVVVAAEGSQPTGSLETLFGPSGWACTNSTALKDIANYGFVPLPQGDTPGDCGSAS